MQTIIGRWGSHGGFRGAHEDLGYEERNEGNHNYHIILDLIIINNLILKLRKEMKVATIIVK